MTVDCKQAYQLIQDRVEKTLGGEAARRLDRHLSRCSGCAARYRAHAALHGWLEEIPRDEVPQGFGEAVISHLKAAGKIFAEAPSARPRTVRAGVVSWARYPVAAALLFAVGLYVLPVAAGFFQGVVGRAAVIVTEAYLKLQAGLKEIEFVYRLVEVLGRDLRAAKTLFHAALSLVATTAESLMLPGLVMLVLIVGAVFGYVKFMHKRSSAHATFGF